MSKLAQRFHDLDARLSRPLLKQPREYIVLSAKMKCRRRLVFGDGENSKDKVGAAEPQRSEEINHNMTHFGWSFFLLRRRLFLLCSSYLYRVSNVSSSMASMASSTLNICRHISMKTSSTFAVPIGQDSLPLLIRIFKQALTPCSGARLIVRSAPVL